MPEEDEKNANSVVSQIKVSFIPILNQKPKVTGFEISNVERFSVLQEPQLVNTINLPLEEKKNEQIGYITTVPLKELIALYNERGDHLFDKNVRYGIGEMLGVDAAIKNTLTSQGDQFWFRHNGIAILVNSKDFHLKYPNKIVFEKQDEFYVVNGAQTLSIAAQLYYSTLAEKRNTTDKKAIEALSNILDNIEKARVLLRIIWINNGLVDTDNKTKEISIALNRQKPIKIEDIAFVSDYVRSILNNNIVNPMANNCSFKLIKRGEVETKYSMTLIQLARAREACIGRPDKARNGSAQSFLNRIVKRDPPKRADEKPLLFPDFKSKEEYEKHFKAVRFVHELCTQYSDAKKEVDVSDEMKAALVNNAKWFMISYVIEYLNQTDKRDVNKNKEDWDYSSFDFYAQRFPLKDVINEFFNNLAKILKDGGQSVDHITFKTNELYKTILEEFKKREVKISSLEDYKASSGSAPMNT